MIVSEAWGTRTVHFVVHVPKCAGTTIERHFQRHLGERFLYAPRWRNPLRDIVGNRYPGLEPPALPGSDQVMQLLGDLRFVVWRKLAI